MADHEMYVVYNPSNGLYLIRYEPGDNPVVDWGSLERAIEYLSLQAASNVAADIGGGTVGTPK